MRKWTESEAKRWLVKTSKVEFRGNIIFGNKGGLSGLKACSAFDYLKNHCDYKSSFASK